MLHSGRSTAVHDFGTHCGLGARKVDSGWILPGQPGIDSESADRYRFRAQLCGCRNHRHRQSAAGRCVAPLFQRIRHARWLSGASNRQDQQVRRVFDSTVDRYSEIVVYAGLLYYLLDTEDWKSSAMLILLAATGAIMISYARARAEAHGWKAAVGLLARTERVVLLSLGLVIGKPVWALWILAIGTHITAVTRIIHVWRLAELESATAGSTAAKSSDAPT